MHLALQLLVLPVLLLVATQEEFLFTYPFYKYANQSLWHFLRSQMLYALQFVSLEFFFRGHPLKGSSHRFGSGAIFVMLVPYCMVHFGRLLSETFGAIIAGIALGTLAMRTRSIWGGVPVHLAVALTIDWLAVAQCPPAADGPCRSYGRRDPEH